MIKKRLSKEEIIKKMSLLRTNLEIIDYKDKHFIVKDKYGLCRISYSNLSGKYNHNILSSINKTEYFANKLKEVQPDLLLLDDYIEGLVKVKVKDKYGICNCHPYRLLAGAVPCIRTAIDKQEYFLNQVKEIHGDRYDYSKVHYINSLNKISIVCRNHGEFKQLPCHHISGQGCKKCISELNDGRWYERPENENRAANMYILKFYGNDEVFFKFGVAVDIHKRVTRLKNEANGVYEIDVMKSLKGTASYCYEIEQRFKRMIRHKKLQYIPRINFGGMFECFKTK